MKFLKYDVGNAHAGDTVVVRLNRQANVKLMDTSNFGRYRRGERYQFHGGLAKGSPIRLQVPQTGQWHVVVDLGGYSGSVEVFVNLVPC